MAIEEQPLGGVFDDAWDFVSGAASSASAVAGRVASGAKDFAVEYGTGAAKITAAAATGGASLAAEAAWRAYQTGSLEEGVYGAASEFGRGLYLTSGGALVDAGVTVAAATTGSQTAQDIKDAERRFSRDPEKIGLTAGGIALTVATGGAFGAVAGTKLILGIGKDIAGEYVGIQKERTAAAAQRLAFIRAQEQAAGRNAGAQFQDRLLHGGGAGSRSTSSGLSSGVVIGVGVVALLAALLLID